MASNLPSKKAVHKRPAVTRLRYILNHTASANYENQDAHYIDLAQGLSVLNRRLYRQGLVYAVKGITVHDTTNDTRVKLNVLPDNWITRAAWIRGFRIWKKMNRQVKNSSQIDGTWADFKVWMSKNHKTQPNTDLALPYFAGDIAAGVNQNNFLLPAGDWDKSKFVTQDPDLIDPDGDGGYEMQLDGNSEHGDTFEAYMLGAHMTTSGDANKFDAIGLIQSYSDSRNQVQAAPDPPSFVSTDPLMNLFDSSDTHDQIIVDLVNDNDLPPYATHTYVGEGGQNETGQALQAQQLRTSPSNPVARCGGFIAPLGLIEVVTQAETTNKIEVVIDLVEGDYGGVAAATYF